MTDNFLARAWVCLLAYFPRCFPRWIDILFSYRSNFEESWIILIFLIYFHFLNYKAIKSLSSILEAMKYIKSEKFSIFIPKL